MSRLRLLFLIMYVLLIFFLSSRPHFSTPGPSFRMKDKIAHYCEYGLLGGLLFGAIGFTATRGRLGTFAFLLAVGLSLGALDEMLQSYVPGRLMDVRDWLADGLGLITALAILVFTPLGGYRAITGRPPPEQGRSVS